MGYEYSDILKACVQHFKKSDKFYICNQIISENPKYQFSLLKKENFPKNKQKIVFYFNDSYQSLDLEDDFTIMHYAIVRSIKKQNHFSMPVILKPLSEQIQLISELPKKPTIGFCGHFQSHPERMSDIKYFYNQRDKFDCNFILRNKFWAGKPHDKTVVKDFETNMMNNIFNICTRGNGNFSIRFFQTISCGKIPVFTNTDIEFPFEDFIDYSQFCIYGDRDDLSQKILDVWNIDKIRYMQTKAFEAYHNYMKIENFPKTLERFMELKYS